MIKNEDIKVTIEKFDVDWLEIKNRCRGTMGLDDSQKEPTREWKHKLLIAEHSPLRHSMISIRVDNIPYCIMGHFVRHGFITPYVSTSREDRTGIPREERRQTDPVTMRLDTNIQSLINISRKRLCMQADVTTRYVWAKIIEEVAKYDKDIAFICVPEGIYRGGCPEKFGKCQKCNQQLLAMTPLEYIDEERRYEAYHEMEEKAKILVKRK